MTILNENFRPVGDVLPVVRRDFPLADKTLANPDSATALVDGEWMTLDSSYKLIRPMSVAAAGNQPASAGTLLFPLWAERGRYDIQASADRKAPLIWGGSWEFETRIFDPAATVGDGVAITALWQPLKAASVDIGGKIVSGLVGHGGVGTDAALIVAYVSRLHTANGGWLRIRGGFGW